MCRNLYDDQRAKPEKTYCRWIIYASSDLLEVMFFKQTWYTNLTMYWVMQRNKRNEHLWLCTELKHSDLKNWLWHFPCPMEDVGNQELEERRSGWSISWHLSVFIMFLTLIFLLMFMTSCGLRFFFFFLFRTHHRFFYILREVKAF